MIRNVSVTNDLAAVSQSVAMTDRSSSSTSTSDERQMTSEVTNPNIRSKSRSFAACFFVYSVMCAQNFISIALLCVPHLITNFSLLETIGSFLNVTCNLLTLFSCVTKRAIYLPDIPLGKV